MEWEQLETALRSAKILFLRNDIALLINNANERSMTHKFAEYLQRQFVDMNVDCEYNRDGDVPKRLVGLAKDQVSIDNSDGETVFPDIIVHQRDTDNNLMVIEAKKRLTTSESARDLMQRDRTKLNAFCEELGYRYGVLLFFNIAHPLDISWERYPIRDGGADHDR